MRLWALVAALLLVTMVLAGCSDDDGGNADPTTTSSSTGTTSSTTSPTPTSTGTTTTQPPVPPPGEPDNSAPAGSISAVPGTGNRTINFTLEGSDPDGDNIVWDLLFGDGQTVNGAELPANASHQYAANGTYNVTFTITDGRLQTTYNVTVAPGVAAPAPGGGTGGPQVVSGSVVGDPVSCAQWFDGTNDPYGTVPVPLDGATWARFDVAPATLGKPFTMDIAPAAPAGGPFELQFYGANNAGTGYFDSADPVTFDIAGNVPAGSAFAVLYACTAGPADFTYTAG